MYNTAIVYLDPLCSTKHLRAYRRDYDISCDHRGPYADNSFGSFDAYKIINEYLWSLLIKFYWCGDWDVHFWHSIPSFVWLISPL